jgi:hypothetical protein
VSLPLYSDLAGAELHYVTSALEQALLVAGLEAARDSDLRWAA